MTTKQAARGKWDGILTQLIGEHAVTRRHGACPICGGKDRYRYDNKRNDGDWFCNVCGVGDGFRLLQESLSIDFATAARRVDEIVNNVEEKPFKPDVDIDRRRRELNRAWAGATEPMAVQKYLISRGIPAEIISVMQDVRGHPALEYYREDKSMVAVPAMVALIRNSKGEPISIHRTYFGSAGTDKKIMPPVETITGGCIRLGEPDDTLVLAEGLETALAAWALTGYPAWATISAHGLAEMKSIPRHVKKVIIAGDSDASFTGQAAAFTCAKTMKQKLKVETVVTMPKIIGTDMLDLLRDLRAANTLVKGNEGQLGLMRWAP
jgi:putative DNA primase/helicase